jgi:hypothetical protein
MTIEISSCKVFLQPGEVDAGGVITLSAEVACTPAHDLSGRSLQVRDHTGALVDTIPFTAFDGVVSTTAQAEVGAPQEPGKYTWSASLAEEAGDTASDDDFHVGDATSFTISVSPHTTRLLVWDVAPTIVIGQHFGMKLGMKCSSGCEMTGRPFEIFDHADGRVAAGALSGEIWPGSEGLFYAALDLAAPEAEGLYAWRVEVPPGEGKYPHKAATARFNVRVVAAPEFTVRIEAWDSKEEAPLPNMSVTMHPYRATTDEQGIAEVKVPKGTYSIYVSGPGYYPVQREMEVAEDVSTRAPLEKEPPQSTVI